MSVLFGLNDVLVYSFGGALAATFVMLLFVYHETEQAKRRIHQAQSRLNEIQTHLEQASLAVMSARKSLRSKSSLKDAEEKISRAITEMLSVSEFSDSSIQNSPITNRKTK